MNLIQAISLLIELFYLVFNRLQPSYKCIAICILLWFYSASFLYHMIAIIVTEIIFKWHFFAKNSKSTYFRKQKKKWAIRQKILNLYQMMIANNHKNTTCNFVAIANVIIIKTTTWNFGQGSLDRKQHV